MDIRDFLSKPRYVSMYIVDFEKNIINLYIDPIRNNYFGKHDITLENILITDVFHELTKVFIEDKTLSDSTLVTIEYMLTYIFNNSNSIKYDVTYHGDINKPMVMTCLDTKNITEIYNYVKEMLRNDN